LRGTVERTSLDEQFDSTVPISNFAAAKSYEIRASTGNPPFDKSVRVDAKEARGFLCTEYWNGPSRHSHCTHAPASRADGRSGSVASADKMTTQRSGLKNTAAILAAAAACLLGGYWEVKQNAPPAQSWVSFS